MSALFLGLLVGVMLTSMRQHGWWLFPKYRRGEGPDDSGGADGPDGRLVWGVRHASDKTAWRAARTVWRTGSLLHGLAYLILVLLVVFLVLEVVSEWDRGWLGFGVRLFRATILPLAAGFALGWLAYLVLARWSADDGPTAPGKVSRVAVLGTLLLAAILFATNEAQDWAGRLMKAGGFGLTVELQPLTRVVADRHQEAFFTTGVAGIVSSRLDRLERILGEIATMGDRIRRDLDYARLFSLDQATASIPIGTGDQSAPVSIDIRDQREADIEWFDTLITPVAAILSELHKVSPHDTGAFALREDDVAALRAFALYITGKPTLATAHVASSEYKEYLRLLDETMRRIALVADRACKTIVLLGNDNQARSCSANQITLNINRERLWAAARAKNVIYLDGRLPYGTMLSSLVLLSFSQNGAARSDVVAWLQANAHLDEVSEPKNRAASFTLAIRMRNHLIRILLDDPEHVRSDPFYTLAHLRHLNGIFDRVTTLTGIQKLCQPFAGKGILIPVFLLAAQSNVNSELWILSALVPEGSRTRLDRDRQSDLLRQMERFAIEGRSCLFDQDGQLRNSEVLSAFYETMSVTLRRRARGQEQNRTRHQDLCKAREYLNEAERWHTLTSPGSQAGQGRSLPLLEPGMIIADSALMANGRLLEDYSRYANVLSQLRSSNRDIRAEIRQVSSDPC